MKYDALNTKINAMHSRFLTHEDYEGLSAISAVNDVGLRINEMRGYANVMDWLEVDRLTRAVIERSLNRSLFDDYEKIRKFAADFNFSSYLDAFFMDSEINIIKMIFSMMMDERAGEFLPEEVNLHISGKYLPDIASLVKSKNMGEFLANLKDTRYYKPLTRIYNSETTVFQFEMQLDLFYYMNLWKEVKKLKGKEGKTVSHIIGTQIDLKNISWIYRFKRRYSLSPELIYAFLIPVNYKLTAQNLTDMVSGRGIEDGGMTELDKSLPPCYRNIFTESEKLEYGYYKKMTSVYKNALKGNSSCVVSAMAYLFFKGLEINNLTTLIESVRYKLGPKEIMKHLYA